MRWYGDQTAELWRRPAGGQAYCAVGRQVVWKVRAAMAQRGIIEVGWTPR